jgi:membrane-bound ClpP family serine protease
VIGRGTALFIIVSLLMTLAVASAPARADGCISKSGYYVASLSADINPGATSFLSASVANAEAACDGRIVFILSTNGGDPVSMQSMIASIQSYESPWNGTFVTLIAPMGAFAFSMGSYIAEASSEIYMVNGTMIGLATPPAGENTNATKGLSAFTNYMQALTLANGRNQTAAGLMVSQGLSYTAAEAVRYDVITAMLNATTIEGALQELGVPPSTPINTAPTTTTTTITQSVTTTVTNTQTLTKSGTTSTTTQTDTITQSVTTTEVGIAIRGIAIGGIAIGTGIAIAGIAIALSIRSRRGAAHSSGPRTT